MKRKDSGPAHVHINLSDNTGQLCIREIKVSGQLKSKAGIKKLRGMLEGQALEKIETSEILEAAKKFEKEATAIFADAAKQINEYQAMFVGHAVKRSHLRTE